MSNEHKEDSERGPQGYASGGVLPEATQRWWGFDGCRLHPEAMRRMGRPQTWIPVEYIDEAVRTIMACGRTDIHWTHFWQYSATGWVSCYGIPETTPIHDALAALYEKFSTPYLEAEIVHARYLDS